MQTSATFDARDDNALSRLRHLIRTLVRARRRQHALEVGAVGLLWTMVVATLIVVAARVTVLDVQSWLVATSVTLVGALTTAVFIWRSRPDDMSVAIDADIELRLKQRLSTAWEYVRADAPRPIAARLAQAALVRRHARRPEHVFPPRYNTEGRFLPVAFIALMVAVMFEPAPVGDDSPAIADKDVSIQGARLGEFGRQLESRARRQGLPRAERQARRMQELGSRMRSGLLTRSEALDRLKPLSQAVDAERLAAMSEGPQTRVGPLRVESVPGRSGNLARALRDSLERTLAGEGPPDARTQSQLDSMGISREQLKKALDALTEGDESRLRELMEELERLGKNTEDAEALDDAGKAINRARRNLGDESVPSQAEPRRRSVPDRDSGSGESRPGQGNPGEMDEFGMGESPNSGRPGAGPPIEELTRQRTSRFDVPEGNLVVIQARGQLGDGEVYSSEARVLPQINEATRAPQAVNTEMTEQAEAVMSESRYPPHRKDFLRRYFLNLSEGAAPGSTGATSPQ